MKKIVVASLATVLLGTATVTAASNLPSDLPKWMQSTYLTQLAHEHTIFPFKDGKLHLNWPFTRYQAMFAFAKLDAANDARDAQIKQLQAEVQQLETASGSSIDKATVNLAQRVMQATGEVIATSDKGTFLGGGFLINDNQTVLTDAHVLSDSKFNWSQPKSVVVQFGDAQYQATILRYAVRRDLVLLHLDKPVPNATPLSMTTADPVVGQSIIVVGSPLGQYNAVSKGIISELWNDPDFGMWNIQVDAPMNPGNSGGPVVTYDGKVVGISDWGFVYPGPNNTPTIPDGMGQATSWKEINAFLTGKYDGLPPQY